MSGNVKKGLQLQQISKPLQYLEVTAVRLLHEHSFKPTPPDTLFSAPKSYKF